ncbi:hypothetical protein GA0115240_115422 [Streptomyces sp. DvalAA-14]|uniref:hypothetical protein n=1 Tax=unclassified Streptomyces TaxID=2593676 RepID=UPI00081B1E12|nr:MULTISPECIES: hypothetical protein [unclassified Streptomyces]MYS20001.1 hypothetical protein [Streptomyces sp. SID4948]SCD58430.1 hypothetical protein GA0115240_115422 [Streptomyces sp. DvalAA-14]
MNKSAESQEPGGFELRLLGELKAVVAERAATAAAPAPVRVRPRWRRPAAALGGAVALGTVLALVVPVLTHSPTSRAYAVEVGRGGTVTITYHDFGFLRYAAGREDLHRRLLAAGIRNTVAGVAPYCVTGSHDAPGFMEHRSHSVVLHPDRLPATDELLIGIQGNDGPRDGFTIGFTEVRIDPDRCGGSDSPPSGKPATAPVRPPDSAQHR